MGSLFPPGSWTILSVKFQLHVLYSASELQYELSRQALFYCYRDDICQLVDLVYRVRYLEQWQL